MAESFVKTMKRDYVTLMLKPDAVMAVRNLAVSTNPAMAPYFVGDGSYQAQ
jgi:hypothetical protein